MDLKKFIADLAAGYRKLTGYEAGRKAGHDAGRPKPVQAIKFDRVVVARRMQHHAVRCRACLFVADIGVAQAVGQMCNGRRAA
jgi:hypothetical protein